MDDLYTIVFDPHYTGEFCLFDRVFYTSPDVPQSRCDELLKFDLFRRYQVVKVSFEFLNIE